MRPAQLKRWMARNGYSVRGLAGVLQIAPSTVQRYRDGELPISRTLELALETLEQRRR